MVSDGIRCLAWHGSYVKENTFNGKTSLQDITEWVIATENGVNHYKIVKFKSGKLKIFTDIEVVGCPRWLGCANEREMLKKQFQWGRTNRSVTMNGSRFAPAEWENVADLDAHHRISDTLSDDQAALLSWQRLAGLNNKSFITGLLDDAVTLTVNRRETYLQQKALAMAEIDPQWGIF